VPDFAFIPTLASIPPIKAAYTARSITRNEEFLKNYDISAIKKKGIRITLNGIVAQRMHPQESNGIRPTSEEFDKK